LRIFYEPRLFRTQKASALKGIRYFPSAQAVELNYDMPDINEIWHLAY